ncbi:MAG: TRAP transporter substrate-binding protein DctP [Methylacidiphilales bacterium]|nr:TRAP transporter substrate-binding protein DctP [Candidatus Methylacidiphilales bacterium]
MTPRLTIILRLLSVVIVTVCIYFISQSLFTESKKIIKIAFLGSKNDEDYFGSLAFKETVERISGGKISVLIYPSGQFCGNEQECVEGLRAGTLEIHMTTFGFLSAFYPPAIAIDFPYILNDDTQAECVFQGELVDSLRDKVLANKSNIRLMTIGNTGGWRAFANNKRPITNYDDFSGLKFRVISSDLHFQFIRALSASPTPVPWSELYTAVSEGVVDGTNNSLPDLVSVNLHKSLKYYSVDNNQYMGALWWYSEKKWNGLSATEQEWVEQGFTALRLATINLPKKNLSDSITTIERVGGTINFITQIEREKIKSKILPVLYQWYRSQFSSEWLDRFEKIVASCPSEVR